MDSARRTALMLVFLLTFVGALSFADACRPKGDAVPGAPARSSAPGVRSSF